VKLLVLGGTKFLGRAAAQAALERGHEVTLFNRGQTNPDLFPEAEKLRGDRDGDLSALEGRSWDTVIDPSGFVPRVVRASVELLAGTVGHYVFVSSLSVYAEPLTPGFDESAPTVVLSDPTVEDWMTMGEENTYGGLKALSEDVVSEVFPGSHTNVRAGLIVGPHDASGRFTYWPVRVATGGEVLAPAPPERSVQFIDVRDLAGWMVIAAEERITGTFNATGEPLGLETVLETARDVSGSDARFEWVDEALLLEREVGPWMELPLWIPGEENEAFHRADTSRARAAGLRTRPLADTVRDTLAWARASGAGIVTTGAMGDAGLQPEREAELLDAWAAAR
jgi:2'-hydroxyisoflavone reductase